MGILNQRFSAIFIMSALLGSNLSEAATYYVAPSGKDTNSGTLAQPFQTIQKAANIVNPGDTVIVKDGIYKDLDGDGSIVWVQRSGSPGAFITFKSENKWGAKLDGQNFSTSEGWSFGSYGNASSGAYIRIEGFEIFNLKDQALMANGSGNNLQIVGNHIHNIGRICTDNDYGKNGFYLTVSNVTIEQNLIHDIGRLAPNENGCNASNWRTGSDLNYQNHDHGIYADGVTNLTIRNNIFYNNNRGWSITWINTTNNVTVTHNTFAGANPWRDGYVLPCCGSHTNSRIENNIFYKPSTSGVVFYTSTGSATWTVRNNLTEGGVAVTYQGAGAAATVDRNFDNTVANLVDPANRDYRLTPNSAAIDSATVLGTVLVDYANVPRPIGTASDIGAFEYKSGDSDSEPPSPPQNVMVH